MRRMSPEPVIFDGPIIPDLVISAGAGGTLGGVMGFVVGSFMDLFRATDPSKIATRVAGWLGTFGAFLVLFSRLWT